jgi:enoyl-CoA hydratase/carnithine racemase
MLQKLTLGFVFARRGIAPEATSTYLLPQLVGRSRALQLCLTGRVYLASDPALDLLFSEIVEGPKDVLPAAMELAKEIASKNSVMSTALTKSLINHATDSVEDQHLLDSRALFWLGKGDDAREGVASFIERREPNFKDNLSSRWPDFAPWWRESDTRLHKASKI